MTKNGIGLSLLLVVLAGAYVVWFTDWLSGDSIQILPTVRPLRQPGRALASGNEPVCPVSFALDAKYKLTSIKVVAAADLETNKYPNVLWHVVSDSNSVPTKSIDYGRTPKGMRPAAARAQPEPLLPEVTYVLMLEAGGAKARTNFHTLRAP
jgi:hypothetical protein